jgi:hypothetical protein
MGRCCAFTLLAVAIAVLTAASTPAQPPRKDSKPKPFELGNIGKFEPNGRLILIPSEVGEEQIPDWRLVLAGLIPKNKPPNLDPKLLKELMDKLPKDQKANEKQIQEILEKNPKLKDPAFLHQLGQLKQDPNFPENLNQKLPKDIHVPKDGPVKENLEQLIEEGMKPPKISEGGPKTGEPITPPKGDLPKMDPSTSSPTSEGNAGENPWVKWMQKNFGESEAGQQAIKDLMGALEKQDMKGMFDQVPEFKNGGWKDIDSWGKANAGELWNTKPPDFGGTKFNPPNMGGGGSSGPNTSFGSSSGSSSFGGSGSGMGGGGSALAVIAGIAGAALLAVLLFRKWKLNQAERAAAAGAVKAGIDFDSIRTREALVHAFDHVSLDQIGAEARPWNHRVIAEQIATARPAQAEPADELAGLYERARYAPDDEDLSAGEFVSARRDLRVIAGVPA